MTEPFARRSLDDVRALLQQVGLYPRDLMQHRDGAFTAVFSRLQPVTQERRVELLTGGDPSLTILDIGYLPDNGEPYLDFAFLPPPAP